MTINVDDIETEIRQAKNQIRSAGGDLKQGFAALDSLIEEQIAEIEQQQATPSRNSRVWPARALPL